jgi:hypothetical protein
MNDEEIRAVVRQVLAARGLPSPPVSGPAPHASHLRLQMVVPTPPGSPCVIEPAVACNNCGYCLSMGH